jgi:hypothetical protein
MIGGWILLRNNTEPKVQEQTEKQKVFKAKLIMEQETKEEDKASESNVFFPSLEAPDLSFYKHWF